MTAKDASSSLTLGEAVHRLRLVEDPTGDMTATMSSVAERAFDMHDAVHVLFGCGTSLKDEIAAHIWMAFGTTARMGDMHRAVASQEHRKVLSGIGHVKVIGTWLSMLPRIVAIILRTRQMKKRVAFENLSHLMQQPVNLIRAEHGIKVYQYTSR